MANPFATELDKYRLVPSPVVPEKNLASQIGGFPNAVLGGVGSLFGLAPTPDQAIYSAQYPVTSLGASLIGGFGVYGAGLKLTSKVPAITKAVARIGNTKKSPIATAVMRDAAMVLPTEIARVGIGTLIGEKSTLDLLGESAIGFALGAPLVGGFKALQLAGQRRIPLQEVFADKVDLSAPIQLQLRQVQTALGSGTLAAEHLIPAQNYATKLSDIVRTEELPHTESYVGVTPASAEKSRETGERVNSALNRYFRIFDPEEGAERTVVGKKFMRSPERGFANDSDWQAAAKRFGLPEDWLGHVQYPRHRSFRNAQAEMRAAMMLGTIKREMESVGDGWYITRENDDGLYVMAKRLSEKDESLATAQDEWVIFKTDTPGKFIPQNTAWMNHVADHSAFLASKKAVMGPINEIYDAGRAFSDQIELRKFTDLLPERHSIAAMTKKITDKLGTGKLVQGTGEATRRLSDFLVEYMVPAMYQFGRSPRAARALALANTVYDRAQATMKKFVYGEGTAPVGKTAVQTVLGGKSIPDTFSIRSVIDDMTEDDVTNFWHLWRERKGLEQAKKMFLAGEISDKVLAAATRFTEIEDELASMIAKLEDALEAPVKYKPQHGEYGLVKLWRGDNRVALRDETGQLRALASGHSRVGAQREARRLIEAIRDKNGIVLRMAEDFDISQTASLPKDITSHVNNPAFLQERQDLWGFDYYLDPFTKEELLENYAQVMARRTKYMAQLSTQDLLSAELPRIMSEDPAAFRMLSARLNALAGRGDPATKMQNAVVDRMLGPIMGGNSATEIVAKTNQLMWHLELGFGRISYPLMNMLTFAQTVLPAASYVLSGRPETLQKFFMVRPVLWEGKVQSVGVLEPLKLMWAGAARLRQKGDPLWDAMIQRGLSEGVLDPKHLEEFTGQVGERVRRVKDAFSGPGGFVRWLTSLSEYLPTQSEKLSRLHGFAVGEQMARQIYQSTDEDLIYQFAKQFTDFTMFKYSIAARPQAFATPVGSTFGLFKNWMLHYVGMMGEFANEGFTRNNWAPLLWQSVGTAAVGGATAVPLYGLANALMSDPNQTMLEKGYDFFGPQGNRWADGVFFGLPAMLTGQSLSSQAEAPLANPMRDASMMFSFILWDRAKAFGQAFGGAMDEWQATGQPPFSDPNTRDMMIRALAPKTFYRSVASMESGALRSLNTSYPVLNMGLGDRIAYAMGFNPTKLEKAYEINAILWRDQKVSREKTAAYGKAYFNAVEAGDMETLEAIVARATVEGIDMGALQRSVMTRASKNQADVLTRQFSDEDIERAMKVMGEGYVPGGQE